jgi:outer membrane receptor protein involved in Fe transport
MKKSIIWIVKMATFYSVIGLFLQGLAVSILLASTPAEAQNPRDIKIKMNAFEVSLEKAFQMIEKSTNYKFLYNSKEIPVNQIVSVNFDNETVYKILEEFAQNYGLSFNIVNEQIVVKKNEKEEENIITTVETGSVKGKVTDEKTGEVLAGATIVLKGTTVGTYTDLKGYYEIDNIKPGKYTIAASYVGYAVATKTIAVVANKTESFNFELKQSTVNLDEVVVTGGMSEREIRSYSNPLAILKQSDIQEMPTANLNDLLQFNVPGYFVVSSSGYGYGNTLSSGFRGTSSIMNTGIKYFIDGVQAPATTNILDLVDYNNIEKMEVLRGPMATTLYGSSASSGIVNIITKKATTGEFKLSATTAFTLLSDKYTGGNTPWKNEETLNISGGTTHYGYTFGLTHWDRDMTTLPSAVPKFTSYSLNAGFHLNLDQVVIDSKINYINSVNGTTAQPYFADVAAARGWNQGYYGYLNFQKRSALKYNYEGIDISLNIKNILSPNWYHSLSLGYGVHQTNSFEVDSLKDPLYGYSTSLQTSKSYDLRYFMNYNADVNSLINANVTGGFEFTRTPTDYLSFYTKESWNNQFAAAEEMSGTQNLNIANHYWMETVGYFGEAVIGYANKLFLTIGVRQEHYTNATNYSAPVIPRVGLSFVQEFEDLSMTLKPRISWGKNINPPTISQTKSYYTTGYSQLANPDLRPEINSGWEYGMDIYYKNLLSLSLTYYNQKVTDLIYMKFGFSYDAQWNFLMTMQYLNVAEAFNKGLELSGTINLNPFQIKFNYTIINSTFGEGANLVGMKSGERVNYTPYSSSNIELIYNFPSFLGQTNKKGSISARISYTGTVSGPDYWSYYDGNYISGRTSGNLGYKEYPSFYIYGLTAKCWLTNYLQLYGDVKNLFDNQMIYIYAPVSEGREITMGLRLEI